MNQYQRMVSYLYEYKQGIKGVNVGYVKIEQRGSFCRISLQMRGRNLGQIPSVSLFRQEKDGVLYLPLCQLTEHNGAYSCRVETDRADLMGSSISLQEVEGLLLYLSEEYYIATTWKNSEIYLGKMRKWEAGESSQDGSVHEAGQVEMETGFPKTVQKEENAKREDRHGEAQKGENVHQKNIQEIASDKQKLGTQKIQEVRKSSEIPGMQALAERDPGGIESEADAVSEAEIETQEYQEKAERKAICGNCPFQRKGLDYGKRILMTFPAMRPFPNEQHLACVRIEPQDLGCLPMPLWVLANNQFLLQGYYCYRHLIFAEVAEKKYAIGVPGIYSSRDQGQAKRFGFTDFRPICKNSPCMGGFGYWMMPLDISE